MEQPTTLPIKRIVEEAKDLKSFYFDYELKAKPGQFVNVWLPRADEKPFSISYQDKKRFAVTVLKVGPFTEKMHELKEGNIVGIRGPYGNPFKIEGKNIVLVAGGCGAAPLAFLADEAKKQGCKIKFIIGAKSADCLLFADRMKEKAEVIITTDDGSKGKKGFATDALKEIVDNEMPDKVFACGPEIMLKKITEMCLNNSIRCEVSLERYMKCGFGICGQCCLDPAGWRVCKEGPVFSAEQLKKANEFGSYKRDATGGKIKL